MWINGTEWRLVPVEPTPEMLQIGRHAAPYRAVDVYRAMIANAPTPPAQASGAGALQAKPPGIDALQCVIASMRDTAHFSDEEGELTNDLRTLRDWALARAALTAAEAQASGQAAPSDMAHEIWAAAQTSPGEGIEDAVIRIAHAVAPLQAEIEALRELEEREQHDEALLRQALEALELRCGTHADERKELIPALRERLGEGAEP